MEDRTKVAWRPTILLHELIGAGPRYYGGAGVGSPAAAAESMPTPERVSEVFEARGRSVTRGHGAPWGRARGETAGKTRRVVAQQKFAAEDQAGSLEFQVATGNRRDGAGRRRRSGGGPAVAPARKRRRHLYDQAPGESNSRARVKARGSYRCPSWNIVSRGCQGAGARWCRPQRSAPVGGALRGVRDYQTDHAKTALPHHSETGRRRSQHRAADRSPNCGAPAPAKRDRARPAGL